MHYQRDRSFKKNQVEILDMENSIKEIKKELASLGYSVHKIEERISNIEDRNLEMMHMEEEREWSINK